MPEALSDLSSAYVELGDVELAAGRRLGAILNYQHASEIRERIAEQFGVGWINSFLLTVTRTKTAIAKGEKSKSDLEAIWASRPGVSH